MEKIRIITDTASDITVPEAEALNIDLLPVTVVVNGKTYREAYDISKQEFWHILNTSEEMPSTCQITPQQLLGAYQRAVDEGYTHVIVVTISSTGSGMHNNAYIARDLFREEHGDQLTIEIIDSRTYSYLYGAPVMDAAKNIQNGAGFEETVEYLENRLARIEGYLCVYNLKYAKKSGRLSGVAAFVGEVLGFKPVMHLIDGKVAFADKVRGEKELIARAMTMAKERAVDIEKQTVYAMFGDLPEDMRKQFLEKIQSELSPAAIVTGELGCSVSLNAGSIVCAVIFEGVKRAQYLRVSNGSNIEAKA